jgi:alkylated DNA nucleotide flippase Atl1
VAKTAVEKLRTGKTPHIVNELPERLRNWAPAGGSMVVSTPEEVDAVIRQVKKGRLTTLQHIRDCLARRHGTSIACPVTTGIFINISARAAEEMMAMGNDAITPYWRVLRTGGALNEKFPGGLEAQRKKLEDEGHKIFEKGKKLLVIDYEAALAKLRT